VRHGETESTGAGSRWGALTCLERERRRQALQLAAALSKEGLRAVYASPGAGRRDGGIDRTAHGLTVEIEPGLIEMDVGEVEGMTFAELRSAT
jgi:broad specificity phosphatase PhoE